MSPEQIKDKLAPILTGPKILKDADYSNMLPCPWCHNIPSEVPIAYMYGYGIYCPTCEYFGPMGLTADMAVKSWNTRGGK